VIASNGAGKVEHFSDVFDCLLICLTVSSRKDNYNTPLFYQGVLYFIGRASAIDGSRYLYTVVNNS